MTSINVAQSSGAECIYYINQGLDFHILIPSVLDGWNQDTGSDTEKLNLIEHSQTATDYN